MRAIVLCGGIPQLALLRELKRRDITSILIDMDEKALAVQHADAFYPVSTLDVEKVRDIAITEKADFLLSVCADQMMLTVSEISEDLGLPCYLDYETAKKVSDKGQMKRILTEKGIPTSRYVIASALQEADLSGLKYPLIVKPVDSYSSRGVKKVDNYKELIAAFTTAVSISRTGTAVIEEFVDGDEWSVDVYVENGKAIVQCISRLDKVPWSNKFIVCRAFYSSKLTNDNRIKVEAVAQNIADAFHLVNSPMLIQLKTNGDKLSVIEFCARTGGGTKFIRIHEITGFDAINAVIDLTLGITPHVKPWRDDRYIINENLYCNPGVFNKLNGFDYLKSIGIIWDYSQLHPSGYVLNKIESSGDRIAYFSIIASNEKELIKKHRMINDRISVIDSKGEDILRHDIVNAMIL